MFSWRFGRIGCLYLHIICVAGLAQPPEIRRNLFYVKKKLSYEPLDDNSTIVSVDTPFSSLEKSERSCLLKRALLKISSDDREIIIRHYYYNQTVNQISDDMKINAQTVKSKLLRGRNKLKEILERGGDLSELEY